MQRARHRTRIASPGQARAPHRTGQPSTDDSPPLLPVVLRRAETARSAATLP